MALRHLTHSYRRMGYRTFRTGSRVSMNPVFSYAWRQTVCDRMRFKIFSMASPGFHMGGLAGLELKVVDPEGPVRFLHRIQALQLVTAGRI